MEITKVDLKILIKEFLSASNRVLRAGYEIYSSELSKFVGFLDAHELIFDYIKSCGEPEYDAKAEYEEVSNSYGRSIFSLGTTNENEVANIYEVIKYLAENNISARSYVFLGYSNSKSYQEKVNAFGDEFIRVLITHIENYLARISIQMGIDDKTTINFNIEGSSLNNSPVSIVTDSSNFAINTNGNDVETMQKLIKDLLDASGTLGTDDQQTVNDCIETITTIKEENPKKGIIKMAVNTLKGIAGTVEFTAAVTAITQFVMKCL